MRESSQYNKRGDKPRKEGAEPIPGVFHANAKGFGFVVTGMENDSDIFIAAPNKNGAMHKDEVLCRIITREHGEQAPNHRREGEIVRIVKRGYREIIGTYERFKGFGLVYPDDRRLGPPVYIGAGDSRSAVTGHKVAVKIGVPALYGEHAIGEVTDILGHKNDPGVDVLSIVRAHNIRTRFGKRVRAALEDIPDEVSKSDITGRSDLRGEFIITIDGEDTKDIDDAISLTVLADGSFRLGVHIADVSHYVRENTALDKEAQARGTSVYLADRVIPMLPHKLSNGICSLNQGTDRLALSCVMTIDQKGLVMDSELMNSVINVNRRMTYDELDGILSGGGDPYFADMGRLAGALREKRIKRGAIEFDFPEAKIILDDDGKPIAIEPRTRTPATGIIEEFMIVCNETVAEAFFWLEAPFIYRTHEEPDEEKIKRLSDFVVSFGYTLKGRGAAKRLSHKRAVRPGSIQALLSSVESTPEEALINKVVLRSLKQARYTPVNTGHFGLASKCYCHFTSPIRRYPDLQVHRIIKEHLAGGLTAERMEHFGSILAEVCINCSMTERIAEKAWQDVDKLKKTQFMSDKIGQEFDGVVSGLAGWGIYIMLPNTVEGMIPKGLMTDDDYIYNQDMMQYEGRLSGRVIRLGDALRVRLVRIDIDERTIDFCPVD